MSVSEKSAAEIFRYHEQTKHHYERYARSPGYMDWENQPNPFRRYGGVPTVELPFLERDPAASHSELYRSGADSPRPFDLDSIAGLLELSVALSAWKAVGQNRWALRINPSSGNLHPTEIHAVFTGQDEPSGGVYHYNPLYHELEKRASLPDRLRCRIREHFGGDGFFIGITSIFWRESWKYGERALRYCHHDVGHGLAAIRMAANLFGWKVKWLDTLSDEAVEVVLGLDRAAYEPLEEEHPDLLCWVGAAQIEGCPSDLPQEIVDAFAALRYEGRPNRLSRDRVDWEIIGRTARHIRKPETAPSRPPRPQFDQMISANSQTSAAELIRRRRSATSFSAEGSLSMEGLLRMLEKTLPHPLHAPFDLGPIPDCANLILFVHRVGELPPGLYAFVRCQRDLEPLRECSRPEFQWTEISPGFPLFLLEEGNFRQTATMVSCHQSIAGESVFSLGMLSRFRRTVEAAPYRYRMLFWEAGMIGQILYLEAEAQGLRGTGIGCYFDDEVHGLLGLEDDSYQSLYHFTVGLPIEDRRLTTLPPYHHLKNRR